MGEGEEQNYPSSPGRLSSPNALRGPDPNLRAGAKEGRLGAGSRASRDKASWVMAGLQRASCTGPRHTQSIRAAHCATRSQRLFFFFSISCFGASMGVIAGFSFFVPIGHWESNNSEWKPQGRTASEATQFPSHSLQANDCYLGEAERTGKCQKRNLPDMGVIDVKGQTDTS